MADTLRFFGTLSATVKVEEHYIAPDVEPKKRSLVGRHRLEFENILRRGLDRLF